MTHGGSRRARADEVTAWRDEGWVLLEGLVGADEIDAAVADLTLVFPSAEEYHGDPAGVRERWLGRPAVRADAYQWPPTGPGFRADQHRWRQEFPFPGSGALNRLCTQPSIVDFCERALGTDDLRLYQAQLSAKYAGETNYEQPMHADRNHSWLPARGTAPWWHVEGFLYLSDVDEGNAPTHLVSLKDSSGRASHAPLVMPQRDPELYAAERAAPGAPRGVRTSPTGPTCSTAASTWPGPAVPASCSTSATRSPVRTGSGSTRCSRARPGRTGWRSSRARPRATSSCSGSRRRVTPSGTRR